MHNGLAIKIEEHNKKTVSQIQPAIYISILTPNVGMHAYIYINS